DEVLAHALAMFQSEPLGPGLAVAVRPGPKQLPWTGRVHGHLDGREGRVGLTAQRCSPGAQEDQQTCKDGQADGRESGQVRFLPVSTAGPAWIPTDFPATQCNGSAAPPGRPWPRAPRRGPPASARMTGFRPGPAHNPTGHPTTMKILVGYKRVVDYNVRIQVKPDGSGVVTEGVKLS